MAQYDDSGNIEQDHGEPVDRRGQKVFKRMVTHRGRHIDIGIRVMQRMKPPEDRHRMFAPVHEITQQIEQQKTGDQAQTGIGDRPRR